jgi:hypothetical protein
MSSICEWMVVIKTRDTSLGALSRAVGLGSCAPGFTPSFKILNVD